MNSYQIMAKDKTILNIREYGNPAGKPVLFIHGLSQSQLVWEKQASSCLLNYLRLITFDLRGHGFSGKPINTYNEAKTWADDIQLIINVLNIELPILCGWSYGGFILTDYLSIYGEKSISGIILVSAFGETGTENDTNICGAELLDIVSRLLYNDTSEYINVLRDFISHFTYKPLSEKDKAYFLEFNKIVPKYVWQDMVGRIGDNTAVLSRIKLPALLIHGSNDKVILPLASQQLANNIKHAKLYIYEDIGHMPFWECPNQFNNHLVDFIKNI